MSTFLYKTIGGENPQGKPRVYFACHPDDREKYFDECATRILKIQDCAVWYESDPGGEYDPEDLELRLGRMQLFVMPVTTRLLTSPNRAMDVEFPLAMSRHIPVLPLMMEPGLDTLFTRRFGDLQYLDPRSSDKTKRSFDEVLTTYIRAVLADDRLSSRVRAAFDAYIFLSYRKKDRKKAQELMRLIHKNPVCRDIAIWYDEFLTPGENFNRAIEEMLEKSDLFAMAVTPNLVNEDNYVMLTEYPAALAHNKPILPVEMAETDHAALEARYEGLPPCVPGEDGAAFRQALLERLKALAITANDADPTHNYLIGLAYLDGIDVEVDHDRALGLIAGAAESGLGEAMAQLVAMYENGKGVARDYREAVRWQERYTDDLRSRYRAEPSEENAAALLTGLWSLGDKLLDLGQLSESGQVYEEMRRTAEPLAKPGSDAFRRSLSVALDNLGRVAEERGDLAAASRCFEDALAIVEALELTSGSRSARRDLAVSYNRMGGILEARGDLPGARRYYEKGLALARALAEETGTVHARRDLMISYERLGLVSEAQGDPDQARDYYGMSLAIARSLAEETGTAESRRDLSASYSRLGNIARAMGDLSGARGYFQKELVIDLALAEETGTIMARRDLSVGFTKLGTVARLQGDLNDARQYYEKALAIALPLAREIGTPEIRRDLSVVYVGLGDIAKAAGNSTEARVQYEKALPLRETLVRETGTAESRRDLSVTFERLGDAAKAAKDLPAARDYYEKGLALIRTLAQEVKTPANRRSLFVSCFRLGELSEAAGDPIAAQRYFEDALAVGKPLAEETKLPQVRRDLGVTCSALGRIASARGDIPGAKRYFEQELTLTEPLARESDTPKSWWDLGAALFNYAVFLYSYCDETAQAKEIFQRITRLGEGFHTAALDDLREQARQVLAQYF